MRGEQPRPSVTAGVLLFAGFLALSAVAFVLILTDNGLLGAGVLVLCIGYIESTRRWVNRGALR